MLEQALTGSLAVLLAVNGIWCILLHRRLRELRNSGEMLDKASARFDRVLERMRRALATDCAEAQAMERRLHRQIALARRQQSELERCCLRAAGPNIPATGPLTRNGTAASGGIRDGNPAGIRVDGVRAIGDTPHPSEVPRSRSRRQGNAATDPPRRSRSRVLELLGELR